MMDKLTQEEFFAKGKELFGDDEKVWQFQCVRCGGIQTYQDFLDAHIPDPENVFFFSCIGRWVPDRGCNWTLGGFLKLHKRIIYRDDGESMPIFLFAGETVDDL